MRPGRAARAWLLLFFLAVALPAAAEPWQFPGGGTMRSAAGSVIELPPGVYVEEPDWIKLGVEVCRLQDAETRLTAENKSLVTALRSGPYKFMAGMLFGFGVGWWVASR